MSGKVITSSGIGSNTGLDATVTQPEVTSSGTPPATSDGVPSVSTSSTTGAAAARPAAMYDAKTEDERLARLIYENQAAGLTGVETTTPSPARGIDRLSATGHTVILTDVVNSIIEELELTAKVFHVKAYGAKSDGVIDDTTAIRNAVTAAGAVGGTVLLPAGTTRCDGQLTLPSGVTLAGEGTGVSILDFSAGTTFADSACIYSAGTRTELGALSTVSADATAIVLATGADTLVAGDVLVIYNATDSSFNTARTYYRAGEFVRVRSVAGTTVNLTEPLVAGYTAGANMHVYKLTPTRVGVHGLTIKAPLAASASVACVSLVHAVDAKIAHVETRNGVLGGVSLDRCYEVALSKVRTFESDADTGNNYGISILSCQRVTVTACHLVALRHGLTIGGGGPVAGVPNRQILVNGCTISNIGGGVVGADMHGNCEDVHYKDCILPRGVHIAGDRTSVTHCEIESGTSAGEAVHATELLGLDHRIEGNSIRARAAISASYALVCVGYSNAMDTLTRAGGVLRIANNKIATGTYGGNPVLVHHSGTGTQYDIDVEVVDNEVKFTGSAPATVQIVVRADTGKGFRRVVVDRNTGIGCGIRLTGVNAECVSVAGNTIVRAPGFAIEKTKNATQIRSAELFVLRGNTAHEPYGCGASVQGESASWSIVEVCGNTLVSCATGGSTGDSSTTSSLFVSTASVAIVRDNVLGDVQAVPTQVRLWAADTVTDLVVGDNQRVGTVTVTNRTSITREVYGYTDRANLREAWDTAAPVAGTWAVGDRVWNRTPSAGGDLGWVCTTGGTPGTWKAFGGIAP